MIRSGWRSSRRAKPLGFVWLAAVVLAPAGLGAVSPDPPPLPAPDPQRTAPPPERSTPPTVATHPSPPVRVAEPVVIAPVQPRRAAPPAEPRPKPKARAERTAAPKPARPQVAVPSAAVEPRDPFSLPAAAPSAVEEALQRERLVLAALLLALVTAGGSVLLGVGWRDMRRTA